MLPVIVEVSCEGEIVRGVDDERSPSTQCVLIVVVLTVIEVKGITRVIVCCDGYPQKHVVRQGAAYNLPCVQ